MPSLIQRAYATASGRLAVGHERVPSRYAHLVRDRENPDIYDANFAAAVHAESAEEIEAFLGELEQAYAASDHRCVLWDPEMPAALEARLVLDDWKPHNSLLAQVLDGALTARAPHIDLRKAESDADWDAITEMHWLDHQEEFALGFNPPWGRDVTCEMVRTKRRRCVDVHYFVARVDEVDCGFFSAWPGTNGLGQVEDLFTRREFRGRGIGTALIAACVDDARARGAGPVLVTPRVDDTPKHMYAALGFRPLCVLRSYLKRTPDPAPGD